MPRKEKSSSVTENEIFPTRLREIMEERKVSQEQLGTAIGVRRQTVSLYANGQSKPDTDKLTAIADFFDVSADWLLGRSTVKTADMGIRAVCEKTGLSENAVLVLLELIPFEEGKKLLENISLLIEQEKPPPHYPDFIRGGVPMTFDDEGYLVAIEEYQKSYGFDILRAVSKRLDVALLSDNFAYLLTDAGKLWSIEDLFKEKTEGRGIKRVSQKELVEGLLDMQITVKVKEFAEFLQKKREGKDGLNA